MILHRLNILLLALLFAKIGFAIDTLNFDRELKTLEKNWLKININLSIFQELYDKFIELQNAIPSEEFPENFENQCANFNLIKNNIYEIILRISDVEPDRKINEIFFKDNNFLLFQDLREPKFIPMVKAAIKLTLEILDRKKCELMLEGDLTSQNYRDIESLTLKPKPSENRVIEAPKQEVRPEENDGFCECSCIIF